MTDGHTRATAVALHESTGRESDQEDRRTEEHRQRPQRRIGGAHVGRRNRHIRPRDDRQERNAHEDAHDGDADGSRRTGPFRCRDATVLLRGRSEAVGATLVVAVGGRRRRGPRSRQRRTGDHAQAKHHRPDGTKTVKPHHHPALHSTDHATADKPAPGRVAQRERATVRNIPQH